MPDLRVFIAALLGASALAGALWVGRQLKRSRARSRQRRGYDAESQALALLRSAGFTVLDTQVARERSLLVNGRRHTFRLRADALAQRGRRRYVVEIKTGDQADLSRCASTRRQLLEYRMHYPVDGVVLVDMRRQEVQEVEFPNLIHPASSRDTVRRWSLLASATMVTLLVLGAVLLR